MHSSLAYQISLLRRSFVRYGNERLQERGLTQGLLYFVLYIGRNPDCAQKELAGALHMDAGHTARCIAKLENEGFVRKLPDERDRRFQRLKLTEKGERVFRLCHTLSSQWDEAAHSALDEQEREQLQTLLGKVIRGLGETGDRA